MEDEVCIQVFGEVHLLPFDVQELFAELVLMTAKNTK